MTADIIAFPMGDRMRSIFLARASGRFVNKYDINPDGEEYFQLMETIEVVLDEDGPETWTKEEVDQLVDSFFREIIIDVFTPKPNNDS